MRNQSRFRDQYIPRQAPSPHRGQSTESFDPLTTRPDPNNPGQNTLLITGTAGNDRIIVDLVNGGTEIRARIIVPGPDVNLRFTAANINKIVVFAGAGNDSVRVSSRIFVSANLNGEAGNDRLYGGSGNDLIRGGAGNDRLVGGKGNDLLLGEADIDRIYGQAGFDIFIGGTGADFLVATRNENILIGGTTSFDNDDAALLQIMAQWSGPGTFQQRTDALLAVLNNTSVIDDAAVDLLISGRNPDWFLDFALADRRNVRVGIDRLNANAI